MEYNWTVDITVQAKQKHIKNMEYIMDILQKKKIKHQFYTNDF